MKEEVPLLCVACAESWPQRVADVFCAIPRFLGGETYGLWPLLLTPFAQGTNPLATEFETPNALNLLFSAVHLDAEFATPNVPLNLSIFAVHLN